MSEGFFNMPNQDIGMMTEGNFIDPNSDVMWDQCTSADLFVWYNSLKVLNLQLNLAGYKFKTITFKLSNAKSAVFDADTMLLQEGAASANSDDIVIEVDHYFNDKGQSLGIPVNDISETTEQNCKVELKIDSANNTIKFNMGNNAPFSGRRDNIAATNPDDTYITRLEDLVEKLIFKFESYLSLRWWMGHSDYEAVTKDDMLYRVPEYVASYEQLEAVQGQELSPDNDLYPAGLMWILNPDNWGVEIQEEAPELYTLCTWIFTQFRKMNEEDAYALFMNEGRKEWFLRKLIKHLNAKFTTREREASFLESIEKLQLANSVFLPKKISENLRYFGYPEIIMILANYGLITIPSLGAIEPVEDTALPYDFVLYAEPETSRNYKKVEIFLRGYGPVTMELVYPVKDYDMGVTYGAESSFSWEYIPAKPDAEEEAARKNNLILVAAPGVRITGTSPDNLPPDCAVHIYRVQSHDQVPEWYSAIDTSLLEFTKNFGTMPPGADIDMREVPEELHDLIYGDQKPDGMWERFMATEHSEKVTAFVIKHRKDGVTITYPSINAFGPVSNRYNLSIDIDIDPHAADQRFSYDILKTPRWNTQYMAACNIRELLFQQYFLIIHYCGNVRFKVKETNSEIINNCVGSEVDGVVGFAQEGWVRYLMYEVDFASNVDKYKNNTSDIGHKLNAVAPQGLPLKYNKHHYYVKRSVSSLTDLSRRGDIWDEYTGQGWTEGTPGTMTLTETDLGAHEQSNDIKAIATFRDIATDNVNYGFVSNVTWGQFWSRLFMEVSVGLMFPLAGDVIDIAETMQAYKTRKDKWGEPVSDLQFKFMMAGACLPIVTSGAMKSLAGRLGL